MAKHLQILFKILVYFVKALLQYQSTLLMLIGWVVRLMRSIFITVVPLIKFQCYNLLMSGMLNQTRCSLQQSLEEIQFNHSSTQGMSNFNNMEQKMDSVMSASLSLMSNTQSLVSNSQSLVSTSQSILQTSQSLLQASQSLVSELGQLKSIMRECREDIKMMKAQISQLSKTSSLSQLHSQAQNRQPSRQLSSIQLRQQVPNQRISQIKQVSSSLIQALFNNNTNSVQQNLALMKIIVKQSSGKFQSRGRHGEDQRM